MKTIVAGSRGITNIDLLNRAIRESNFKITEIVSGGADGVDSLGEQWALANEIPVKKFIPSWSIHGRAAGSMRNQVMAEYADALIAVWDGKSRGTADMIRRAKKEGLKVFVFDLSKRS